MTDFPTITLEEIAVLLPKLGKTLILTHINPDGDCLGTAFGLAGILKVLGYPARVACPSPMPNRLRFLAGGDGATKAPPVKLADWEQDFPIIGISLEPRLAGRSIQTAAGVDEDRGLAAFRRNDRRAATKDIHLLFQRVQLAIILILAPGNEHKDGDKHIYYSFHTYFFTKVIGPGS